MLGKNEGRAARIRPADDRNLQVGKLQAGIGGSDPRIIPFRYFAEKNVGVDIVWQLQLLRAARKVVGEDDFTGGDRQ
jgi:hypothetical protein